MEFENIISSGLNGIPPNFYSEVEHTEKDTTTGKANALASTAIFKNTDENPAENKFDHHVKKETIKLPLKNTENLNKEQLKAEKDNLRNLKMKKIAAMVLLGVAAVLLTVGVGAVCAFCPPIGGILVGVGIMAVACGVIPWSVKQIQAASSEKLEEANNKLEEANKMAKILNEAGTLFEKYPAEIDGKPNPLSFEKFLEDYQTYSPGMEGGVYELKDLEKYVEAFKKMVEGKEQLQTNQESIDKLQGEIIKDQAEVEKLGGEKEKIEDKKTKLEEAKEQLSKIPNNDAEEEKIYKEKLTQLNAALASKKTDLPSKIALMKSKIKTLKNESENIKNKIDSLYSANAKLVDTKLARKTEENNDLISKLEKSKLEVDKKIKNTEEKINKIEADIDNKIKTAEEELNATPLRKKINLEELITTEEPNKTKMQNEIQLYKSEIQFHKEEAKNIELKIGPLNIQKTELDEKIQKAINALDETPAGQRALTAMNAKDEADRKEKLKDLPTITKEEENDYNNQLKKIREEEEKNGFVNTTIQNLSNKKTELESKIKSNKNQIENKEKEIAEIDRKIGEAENDFYTSGDTGNRAKLEKWIAKEEKEIQELNKKLEAIEKKDSKIQKLLQEQNTIKSAIEPSEIERGIVEADLPYRPTAATNLNEWIEEKPTFQEEKTKIKTDKGIYLFKPHNEGTRSENLRTINDRQRNIGSGEIIKENRQKELGATKENAILSNAYVGNPLVINGESYKSVMHYMLVKNLEKKLEAAQELPEQDEIKEQIKNVKEVNTAEEAYDIVNPIKKEQVGGKHKGTAKYREGFSLAGLDDDLKTALYHKFVGQDGKPTDEGNQLLETGDMPLYAGYEIGDPEYGVQLLDNNTIIGNNKLGQYLMQLRSILSNEETNK